MCGCYYVAFENLNTKHMKKIIFGFISLLLVININAQNDTIFNDFSSEIMDGEQVTKGNVGSFGKSLSQLSSFVSLNGYGTNEFLYYEDGTNTFNQHYFNLLASAEISEHIFAEIQMEYEYGGNSLSARYAQIDYKFSDLFIIRSGKFLIPAGEYNEYLYPEFISKTVSRAFVNREIIPVSWGEIGVQIRGQYKINNDNILKPFYSIYMVNGLKGENNAGIRGMRGNALDTLSGNLAFGGNIGTQIKDNFNIQFNYYQGDYDTEGKLDLSIFGTSFGFDNKKLSIYGSLQAAKQDIEINSTIKELFKYGFYGQLAYKFKSFEPVLRYDQINLDGNVIDNRDRITLGLNYHIYENCVFKVNYEIINNDGIDKKDNIFSLQLAVGF